MTKISSTMLSVGTLLRRAEDTGAEVSVLVSDSWLEGRVIGCDGLGAVLDGGDGQALVPPGAYYIEIHVNPPYAPDAAGNCPIVKDPKTGQCHQFAEKDYANNVGRALISIPDHLGRDGYGPLKNSADPTADDEMRKPW